MKKDIIVAAALGLALFAGISAHAAADTTFDGPVRVAEPAIKITAVKSSMTVVGMAISSAPATNVMVSNAQMFSQVCVQNLNTTSALYCGESIGVSSITASGAAISNTDTQGVIVPPASSAVNPLPPTCFGVVPGYPFYCRTGSVSAATRAVISRVR